ncbi:hypothetical protein PCYB_063230, partial [Plasmodium cynomolgi strain B]
FIPLGESLGKRGFLDKSLNGRVGRSLFQRQYIADMYYNPLTPADVQYYEDDFEDDNDEEMDDESATEDGVDDTNSDVDSITNTEKESVYEKLYTSTSNNMFLKKYKELKLGEIKDMDSDRSVISKAMNFIKKLNIHVELELLDILSGSNYHNPFTIRIKSNRIKFLNAMYKCKVFSPVIIGALLTLSLLFIHSKLAFIAWGATILFIVYLLAKVWKCENIILQAKGNPKL